MTWTKRSIVASLVMATLGAIIGGFYAGAIPTLSFDPLPYSYRAVPLGIVPGFLSCFLVSVWYLKFMQKANWIGTI